MGDDEDGPGTADGGREDIDRRIYPSRIEKDTSHGEVPADTRT